MSRSQTAWADTAMCMCGCNEGERLVRALTDENGQFLDFPGIEHGSWEQHLTRPFEPVTRFAVSYNRFKEDGLAELVWMVQPDGRLLGDEDGFGGGKRCGGGIIREIRWRTASS